MPIRYRLQFGWNSASDHEWQYRKTLDKCQRDEFDALDDAEKSAIVQGWAASLT